MAAHLGTVICVVAQLCCSILMVIQVVAQLRCSSPRTDSWPLPLGMFANDRFESFMWRRLLDHEVFAYSGDPPPLARVGYAPTVQHRNPSYVGNPNAFILFRPHRQAYGNSPAHHRVTEHWLSVLLCVCPDLILPPGRNLHPSYGWLA